MLKVNFTEITIRNAVEKVSECNLEARRIRGAMVLATGIGLERVLRLVRNMILARISGGASVLP